MHIVRRGPRSLQHPAFLRVWLVGLTAYLARFTDYTMISWLVVQRTDDSPFAVGLLIFLRFSSFLFAGPFIGLIADRFPRIRIMRAAQGGTALGALAMGALLFTGALELWHIYAYTFINGLIFLFDVPARRSYVSGVVGTRNLTAALALDMLSLNAAWFIGSNAAGALLTRAPAGYLYVGLAVVGVVNIWLLRGLPVLWRRRTAEQSESFLRSFGDGVRFVRSNRVLLGALAAVGVTNFTGYSFESMAAVFARDVFNAGPLLFGLLISAQGLGSLVTSLGIVMYGKRFTRPGLMVLAAAMAMHVMSILFSLITWAPAGFAMLLALGMVSMVFSIMHNSLLLAITPNRMRGRVMGIQMLVIGLFPIGSLVLGMIASAVGPGVAVRITATFGVGALAVIALAFPELRRAVRPSGTAPETPSVPAAPWSQAGADADPAPLNPL